MALRKYVNLKAAFGHSKKNNGTEIVLKFNSFGFKISHDDTRPENTNKKGLRKVQALPNTSRTMSAAGGMRISEKT